MRRTGRHAAGEVRRLRTAAWARRSSALPRACSTATAAPQLSEEEAAHRSDLRRSLQVQRRFGWVFNLFGHSSHESIRIRQSRFIFQSSLAHVEEGVPDHLDRSAEERAPTTSDVDDSFITVVGLDPAKFRDRQVAIDLHVWLAHRLISADEAREPNPISGWSASLQQELFDRHWEQTVQFIRGACVCGGDVCHGFGESESGESGQCGCCLHPLRLVVALRLLLAHLLASPPRYLYLFILTDSELVLEISTNKELGTLQRNCLLAMGDYDKGLDAEGDSNLLLGTALWTHFFGKDASVADETVDRVAAYVRREMAVLGQLDRSRLHWGQWRFGVVDAGCTAVQLSAMDRDVNERVVVQVRRRSRGGAREGGGLSTRARFVTVCLSLSLSFHSLPSHHLFAGPLRRRAGAA